MKKLKELNETSVAALEVGELFEYQGESFLLGTMEHGLRHSSHGEDEDSSQEYNLKNYARLTVMPVNVAGIPILFGDEAIASVMKQFQYSSRQASVNEIEAAIDAEKSTAPEDLPILIPGVYTTSVRSKLTKADKKQLDLFETKLAKSGKLVSDLPAMGGIKLTDESSDKQKARWMNAFLLESDF